VKIALGVRLARQVLEHDVGEDEIERGIFQGAQRAFGAQEVHVSATRAIGSGPADHLFGEIHSDDAGHPA
jgi:hypothetical protein